MSKILRLNIYYHNILLLRVNIDSMVSLTGYIREVCTKTSQKTGVIMRLRNLIPVTVKLQLYKVIVDI